MGVSGSVLGRLVDNVFSGFRCEDPIYWRGYADAGADADAVFGVRLLMLNCDGAVAAYLVRLRGRDYSGMAYLSCLSWHGARCDKPGSTYYIVRMTSV
jgi:hypothetical protein